MQQYTAWIAVVKIAVDFASRLPGPARGRSATAAAQRRVRGLFVADDAVPVTPADPHLLAVPSAQCRSPTLEVAGHALVRSGRLQLSPRHPHQPQ
jgi:hypothetical protein